MTSFPGFVPQVDIYPEPIYENLITQLPPFPTSSWFQEGIVNNIADVDRVANGTPWYIHPRYEQLSVGLTFGSVDNVTTALDYGNVVLQEAPVGQLSVEIDNSNNLILGNVNTGSLDLDLGAKLNYFNDQTLLATLNAVRGSPTINIDIFDSSVILKSLSGLIPPLNRIGNTETYFLESVIPISSTVSAPLFRVRENVDQSRDLSFYRFVNRVPGQEVDVLSGVIDNENVVQISYMKDGFEIFFRQLINQPSTYQSAIPPGYSLQAETANPNFGFVLTNNQTNEVDKVIVSIGEIIVDNEGNRTIISPKVEVIRVVQERHRWILYTNATIVNLDQGASIVRTNRFTGQFRIAYAGRVVNESQVDFFGSIFDQLTLSNIFNQANIKEGMIPSNFTETTTNGLTQWSYQMIYDTSGILFFPPHLVSDQFMIEGIEPVLIDNEPIQWLSLSYGRVSLYRIINGNVRIRTKPIQVELFPNLTNLLTTPESRRLMRELILIDTDKSLEQLTRIQDESILTRNDLNPYTFGTIIFKAARVLYFAITLRELLDIPQIVIDFLQIVINANLTTWLDGTNNPSGIDNFQFQIDPIWRGVIVPADVNNLVDDNAPTSYGNSFYNDHHFQYGYLIYALAILQQIGFGLFSVFSNQIISLIQDYANNTNNPFIRLRHKDLFYGHSWATGVPGKPTDDPGSEDAGPVNRQQESVSEAINAYYAAYIMSRQIPSLQQFRAASGLSMYLEIAAARFYYLYDSPESQIGDLRDTGSIGILQTLGKSFTLNFGSQPPTFPGRLTNIYGIQFIPASEITGNYFIDDQTLPFNQAMSRYALRMSESGMDVCLVKSILNGTYRPDPTEQGPYSQQNYAQNDGSYWGNVALMILAFSREAASDDEIRKLYSILIRDLENTNLKEFDSFSNTYYILLRLRGVAITPALSENDPCHLVLKKYTKKLYSGRKLNGKDLLRRNESESESDASESHTSISTHHNQSNLEHKRNKYKYMDGDVKAELFVIRKQCAMLRIYVKDQLTVIHKEELPYIICDCKDLKCSDLAKFIILYESYKKLGLFSDKIDKYLKDEKYEAWLSKYQK